MSLLRCIFASAALAICLTCSARDDKPCTELEIISTGLEKVVIREPGFYCLKENLHARFDMADHASEGTLIRIIASDVILDLQGHTLGRGGFMKKRGGLGISIIDSYQYKKDTGHTKNIVIRNGIIQDFETGVGFYVGRILNKKEDPSYNEKTRTFFFPLNGIKLENIVFRSNKTNFDIRAP